MCTLAFLLSLVTSGVPFPSSIAKLSVVRLLVFTLQHYFQISSLTAFALSPLALSTPSLLTHIFGSVSRSRSSSFSIGCSDRYFSTHLRRTSSHSDCE
jgi:hypothetical protein